MTTQIVFNIDPKIKAKAMQRAKKEGVPFASVLKFATKAFANGELSVGLLEKIRPEKLKLWERESRLVEQGNGKHFASAKKAMEYVESLL